jgi:hypothetical protein
MVLPKCSYIEPSTTELGKCYPRLRDKIGHKPSPWTIPEVRAYWDEYDASIAWYDTDGHLIDVDVNALIEKQKDEALVLRGRGNRQIAETGGQFQRWELHIKAEYTRMRADHKERMASKAYRKLVEDEIKEDERALQMALQHRDIEHSESDGDEPTVTAQLRQESAVERPTTRTTRRRSHGQIISPPVVQPASQQGR